MTSNRPKKGKIQQQLSEHWEHRKLAKVIMKRQRIVEVLLSGRVTAKKLKEGMYYHLVVTTSCIKEGFLILTDG